MPMVGMSDKDLIDEQSAEIERLRAALDQIAGICLGDRDSNLPAAKIHKLAVDALRGQDEQEGPTE